MSDKITSNIFYVGIISVLLSVIASVALIFGLWRQSSVQMLENQGRLLLSIYNEYGLSGLYKADTENICGYIASENSVHIYDFSGERNDDKNVSVRLDAGGQNTIYLWEKDSFRSAYPWLITIIFCASVVLLFVSVWRARRIVRPIHEFIQKLDTDIISAGDTRIYPELEPLTSKITAQRRDSEYMRHEFTANVTHELKTPLTSISGYAEMIANGMARPNDVSRFAEIIQAESNRMLMLVNDIIELSRLDNCEKIESPEPVDLYTVAEECSDQLSASAEKRNVSISLEGQSTIVMGDEGKLWELIYNLTDNAISYNRDGGSVTIITGNKSVTVKDTGIGIPSEHQKRIFERFYRVDKSHSRMTGGTGLGLSIVKHIAEQHNARITLKSEINVGTEITVDFT